MESTLELYNTMTRKKEVFQARSHDEVKIFTCGPSVYRRPHLGNYRTFLWEDLLQRYLKYLGFKVARVINFTDIEDKSIAEAQSNETSVRKLTEEVVDRFFKEIHMLRIDLPEDIPRSSTSVEQAVKLIKILMEKGYAYYHGRDIFFDPLKYDGFGRLFGLDMSRWPKTRRRFKRDTYPGRRWNLGDFILWHGAGRGSEPSWDADIGTGRPAWNIQDPAIITQHLGNAVDICCGGIDNLYRHHDYNLAVTEAATGVELARFWIHGEHLLSSGKKMSKSIGNIVYLEDLVRDGFTADHVRFFLIYGQHRRRMNLTSRRFREAAGKLDAFRSLVEPFRPAEIGNVDAAELEREPARTVLQDFARHMDDDLDVKGAVDSLWSNMEGIERARRSGRLDERQVQAVGSALRRVDEVLQVVFPAPQRGSGMKQGRG